MPPFGSGTLDPAVWIQAGAVGVLALFVLLMTVTFIWYISRRDEAQIVRDKAWRYYLDETNRKFMAFLQVEGDRRRDDQNNRREDVGQLSTAVRELARAMGSHDQSAVERHQEIRKALHNIHQNIPKQTESVLRRVLNEQRELDQRQSDRLVEKRLQDQRRSPAAD